MLFNRNALIRLTVVQLPESVTNQPHRYCRLLSSKVGFKYEAFQSNKGKLCERDNVSTSWEVPVQISHTYMSMISTLATKQLDQQHCHTSHSYFWQRHMHVLNLNMLFGLKGNVIFSAASSVHVELEPQSCKPLTLLKVPKIRRYCNTHRKPKGPQKLDSWLSFEHYRMTTVTQTNQNSTAVPPRAARLLDRQQKFNEMCMLRPLISFFRVEVEALWET